MIATFCTGFGCLIIPTIVTLIGAVTTQSVHNSDKFSDKTARWVEYAAFAAIVASFPLQFLL